MWTLLLSSNTIVSALFRCGKLALWMMSWFLVGVFSLEIVTRTKNVRLIHRISCFILAKIGFDKCFNPLAAIIEWPVTTCIV